MASKDFIGWGKSSVLFFANSYSNLFSVFLIAFCMGEGLFLPKKIEHCSVVGFGVVGVIPG